MHDSAFPNNVASATLVVLTDRNPNTPVCNPDPNPSRDLNIDAKLNDVAATLNAVDPDGVRIIFFKWDMLLPKPIYVNNQPKDRHQVWTKNICSGGMDVKSKNKKNEKKNF